MTAGQLDLFGDGPDAVDDDAAVGFDPTFATARRIALDEHSWVEHVPGWLGGGHRLCAMLLEQAGWEQRERWMVDRLATEPRLTAQYPDVRTAPQLLAAIADALSSRYGVRYDGLWLNLYRDHRDSTGWHGDRSSCRREICTVPVLSLGATRRFLLRPRDGGPSTTLVPRSGDLVVMGGRCQRDWRHSVPKQTAPAAARISVNFSSSEQARAS
jgi:alkylated DNA repair dioxygenase AlkB